MPCTHQDSAARSYDLCLAAATERPQETAAPRPHLTTIQESPAPAPSISHESADRSNRIFNRLVGAGLAILVILLAAVMLNAGINVEVLS